MFILDCNTIISKCLETAFNLKIHMEIMQAAEYVDFKSTTEFRKNTMIL